MRARLIPLLFHSIANFIVKEPLSLSDHSPIITWYNIYTVNNHLATENTNDTKIYNSTANKSHTENDT